MNENRDLRQACQEIREKYDLSNRHAVALAWIIGKLMKEEKEDGKDERTVDQGR